MSDLYTTLHVSPNKQRCPPERDDDTTKFRTRALSHRLSTSHKDKIPLIPELPPYLSRLCNVHTAVQHALSHALATCVVSPTSDTGIVRNVVNNFSLSTYTGLTTQFGVDDLRRLCWIWEWDGKTVPSPSSSFEDDDDPFLDDRPPQKDWTRGAMGMVLSPATHHSRVDIDKDMQGGMAAVAHWTVAGESHREAFREKVNNWVKLHPGSTPVPPVPCVDLPPLSVSTKTTSLRVSRTLASLSPKSSLSPYKLPTPPSSPSRSPSKSKNVLHPFPIHFPLTSGSGSKSPTKSSVIFPQTPSSLSEPRATELTPHTPRTSSDSGIHSQPSTPVRQRGAAVATVPTKPSSSRRQALYERVRQHSLTASPTKAASSEVTGGKLTREQMLKMGQDELRRRCLLGRLGGVVESVWMMFSAPAPR
ncbi:hypothetical protein B0H13DRAFT_2450370 [Mycena leptocephala]|nr:hypothetical protein B0H13DRAFT_2450370 [Mycena leptocephala]